MLNTALENLLNRGLPRSPRARALCAQLAGKSLAIEARDLTRLRLRSNGATLEVVRDAAPADASLAGGALSLLGLLGGSPQAVLQSGAVRMGGDTDLAHRFHELLVLLRPDAEEELSVLLGDVPAHQLARLAQRAGPRIRASPTRPSTLHTSAPTSCRAPRVNSSCVASMRCARASIAPPPAWKISRGGAAHSEAAGRDAVAGDPARAP